MNNVNHLYSIYLEEDNQIMETSICECVFSSNCVNVIDVFVKDKNQSNFDFFRKHILDKDEVFFKYLTGGVIYKLENSNRHVFTNRIDVFEKHDSLQSNPINFIENFIFDFDISMKVREDFDTSIFLSDSVEVFKPDLIFNGIYNTNLIDVIFSDSEKNFIKSKSLCLALEGIGQINSKISPSSLFGY